MDRWIDSCKGGRKQGEQEGGCLAMMLKPTPFSSLWLKSLFPKIFPQGLYISKLSHFFSTPEIFFTLEKGMAVKLRMG